MFFTSHPVVGLWDFWSLTSLTPGLKPMTPRADLRSFARRPFRRTTGGCHWMSWESELMTCEIYIQIWYIHPATWIEVGRFFCLKVVPPGDLDSWQLPSVVTWDLCIARCILFRRCPNFHRQHHRRSRVESWAVEKGNTQTVGGFGLGMISSKPFDSSFLNRHWNGNRNLYIWYNGCSYAVMAYMRHDIYIIVLYIMHYTVYIYKLYFNITLIRYTNTLHTL